MGLSSRLNLVGLGSRDHTSTSGPLELRCIRSLPNAKDKLSPFGLHEKYTFGSLFAIAVIATSTNFHKATCHWMTSLRVILPPAFHRSCPQSDLWQGFILDIVLWEFPLSLRRGGDVAIEHYTLMPACC